MTQFYPDVSNLQWDSDQDVINFLSQLHAEGFAGVVHKVSQGSSYADPYWQTCRSWCEQNDLSWLGYCYVTTDDPDAQAEQFNANNGGPFAMLDFEYGAGDIDHFWDVVNAFNNAGVSVSMAYFPKSWWGRIGDPDLSYLAANQISLISANYPGGYGTASELYANVGGDGGPGWSPYGGATPTVWQFTDCASIAGLQVDCNAYNGPGPNLDALFTGNVF